MCRRVVDGREALPKTTVLPPPFVVYVRRRALVAASLRNWLSTSFTRLRFMSSSLWHAGHFPPTI